MKTKILSIVLVFAIALFLLGCGTKTTEKQTTEQQTTTQTSDESTVVTIPSEESEVNANGDSEDVEIETVEVEIIAETEDVEEESEETPSTVEVKIDGYAFEEKILNVKAGTTVVWENYDSVPHTVTGDGLDSGKLSKGDIYEYTFTEPGTYEYYCAYHPSMIAKVIVE